MERISIQKTATVAPATLMHVVFLLNKKKKKENGTRGPVKVVQNIQRLSFGLLKMAEHAGQQQQQLDPSAFQCETHTLFMCAFVCVRD